MKQNLKKIIAIVLVLTHFSVFASAQNSVVPIFTMSADEEKGKISGFLLGGVENGKFINADTAAAKLKGIEKYSLYNLAGGRKDGVSLIADKEGWGACPENHLFKGQADFAPAFAVGGNANWEVLPRKAQKVSLSDASYKKAVAGVLLRKGLRKSVVKITQALRVDLDGDKRDEILLVATNTPEDANANMKVGAYSLVIVRKNIGGKTQDILVEGSFLTKKSDYFDGEYSIDAIADLNGDGKMEILVSIMGYEENWDKVFEIKGAKTSKIEALSYYCGV